jgi:diacylglycerol kinase (ATP)
MSGRLSRRGQSRPDDDPNSKRPAWRQRLVQAERGIASGVRGDSTFFVHGFTCSIVLAAAVVIGLSLTQWAILILALTLVLAAEMFNQVLKVLLQSARPQFAESAQKALGISTAAVLVSIIGVVITLGLIFGQRLTEIFSS